MRFLLRDAEEAFEWKEGALVAKAGTQHPTDPLRDLDPATWLRALARTNDYLFEPKKP